MPKLSLASTLIAWGAFLLLVALCWFQARWYVFHPHYGPLLALLAVYAIALVVCIITGLRQLARGPKRTVAANLVLAAILPAVLLASLGHHAFRNWERRWIPNDLPMDLAKVMGASLMRLEAGLRYPNRIENQRLVMFYRDLADPRHDFEAMDRHVAQMEEQIGEPLKAPAFWVRGPLPSLGLSGLSTHGIAVAGADRETDWDHQGYLDRHELAHVAMDSTRQPGSDPPYCLHEGWAELQGNHGDAALMARRALEERDRLPGITLRDLLDGDWYHRDAGPVYSIGGALAEFLIRTEGMAKYVRLFRECRPGQAEAKVRAIYGKDLDAIESAFWEDVRAR
jgi:hypothetical protein